MKIQQYCLPARDGYPLAVTSYRPEDPRYCLLINSATGIHQQFYRHFSHYAAERGAWVLTYDYRGIAKSSSAHWNGRPPCMSDWGQLDLASMIDHAAGTLPLAVVGHSVGGQLLGLADNAQRVQALLGVAAQSGYWRLWPARKQIRLVLNWYAIVPLLVYLRGELPGTFMGGETLPRGVALEWARWCRNSQYMCDAAGLALRPHFASLQAQSRFLCFTDDEGIAPERAVRELASFYVASAAEVQVIAPEPWQIPNLGHFGFFRSSCNKGLWDQELDWLERALRLAPLRLAA